MYLSEYRTVRKQILECVLKCIKALALCSPQQTLHVHIKEKFYLIVLCGDYD